MSLITVHAEQKYAFPRSGVSYRIMDESLDKLICIVMLSLLREYPSIDKISSDKLTVLKYISPSFLSEILHNTSKEKLSNNAITVSLIVPTITYCEAGLHIPSR
jgi:hypothetical protein